MRSVIVAAAIVMWPALSLAQEPRVFVDASGGVTAVSGAATGDLAGEAGVRVAPNLFVFGNVGRFRNLDSSSFLSASDAVAADFASSGLNVTNSATTPAWYSLGGVRYAIPGASRHVTPYVLAGAGVAHLAPQYHFIYASGTFPGATAPNAGDDVTTLLTSMGELTTPAASNAFMFSAGGGVDLPVTPRVGVNVGYRLSHINADTPVNANSFIVGLGYRF
jgi:opacity protein-like surface antigen